MDKTKLSGWLRLIFTFSLFLSLVSYQVFFQNKRDCSQPKLSHFEVSEIGTYNETACTIFNWDSPKINF